MLTGPRAIAALVVAAALGAFPIVACSSTSSLVAAGGTCSLVTDCQPGLICLPQKNGPSVCSADLSSVQATEDGGAAKEAAAAQEAGNQDVQTATDTGGGVTDTGTSG